MPSRWRRRAGVPLVALAIISTAVFAQDISVASRVSLPADHEPANATHELALHLYTFRGTDWKWEDIVPAVREAAEILATCGVFVARLELNTLETARTFHYFSNAVSRELLRRIEARRPAIFFVQDTRNRPAYDAEAIGLANAAARPELANTMWVAHGARDLPYAIAHELVHVLSDSGEHSAEPGNLMQPETSSANTRLTAPQCARVRERAAANGLVTRRR